MAWPGLCVDPAQPLNRGHPIARDITSMWAQLPYGQWGGGTVWRDLSLANRNNLTFPADAVTWGTGEPGAVVTRTDTGTNTSRMTLAASITTGTTFTVAARFMVSAMPNAYAAVLTAGSANGLFLKNSSGFKLDFISGADKLSAGALTASTWYDIVISVAAGAMTYYINAVADANTFTSIGSMALDGALSDSASERFIGQVRWLAVLVGRALSATDVIELRRESLANFPNMFNWLGRRSYFFLAAAATGNRRRRVLVAGAK